MAEIQLWPAPTPLLAEGFHVKNCRDNSVVEQTSMLETLKAKCLYPLAD